MGSSASQKLNTCPACPGRTCRGDYRQCLLDAIAGLNVGITATKEIRDVRQLGRAITGKPIRELIDDSTYQIEPDIREATERAAQQLDCALRKLRPGGRDAISMVSAAGMMTGGRQPTAAAA